ncbi:hypothetical protein I4F81_000726 [Pyropia yezoensis]|uniref:Uncharacterized protein n=1 Tax=Pyropia yezoensis TaxID=2788 RepID=A0ACC3BJN0_PYRYE|nr:hypothetical protein I4F81_000726 [Neopyropia yezoensis]
MGERHAPRRVRRRGLVAIITTATTVVAAAAAAAIVAVVAPAGVVATPARRVAPNLTAGAPPGVSVVFHPALWGAPRTAAAAPVGVSEAGGTIVAAASSAAVAALAPSTVRRFVPSDLAATFSVVDRPTGAFSRSACPASTLRHERVFRRGAHPNVYDVPHAFIFMDGESCGRAAGVAIGRNMTLVAASALASASSAAAAGVSDVWEAVQGRPSMARMLRYTGDARDVWVGWERHNRKCGRSHTYRKGTLFFFIASDTRQLSEVGVAFVHSQPFAVSFNPAVCVLAAPARAAASRLPQAAEGGGGTPSVLPVATSPADQPATPTEAPGVDGSTPSPTATPLTEGPVSEAGKPVTETSGAGPLAAGTPSAGVPTASPPPGTRPATDAEEASPPPSVFPPAVDAAAAASPFPTPTPLPPAAGGNARASDDGGAACFPATARVTLADGRVAPMAALRLGDKVVSRPGGEASAVYLFTHRQLGGLHDFLRIVAAPIAGGGASPGEGAVTRNRTLTLSAGHYVYAAAASAGGDGNGPARLVTAGALRAGDRLRDAAGTALAVESVSPVTVAGLINPHTLAGELIVDGVHVSCLTAAVAPRLARALLAPLAWAWRAGFGGGCLWAALHHSPPQQVLALLPGGESTVEL